MSKIECQVGAVGRQVMVAGDKIEGKSSRQREGFSLSKSKLTVNDPGHYDGCLPQMFSSRLQAARETFAAVRGFPDTHS